MDDDPLFGLFLFGVGIFLLAVGLLLLATVYIIVLTIVSYIQYRQYLNEAGEDFDEVEQETGVALPTDEILMTAGIEVPEATGFETVADWMAGTPMGVTQEWEN